MSSVVIVGAADSIRALKARAGVDADALAFHETQTLEALDTILQHRPNLVVIERLFATTPRGMALINRIKADPALNDTEIRILAPSASYERTITRRDPAADEPPENTVTLPPPASLDYRGTRRAPRFKMHAAVRMIVDGTRVTLVDLSTLGAQVLSARPLRPDQRVRVSIGVEEKLVRVAASIVWAHFEMPQGRTYYRAGLEFIDPDVPSLEAFCQQYCSSAV